MKTLFLIRGVSGSGKTTMANEMVAGFRALGLSSIAACADDYFMEDGKYEWDASQIQQAHLWCQQCVCNAMDAEINCIVVHNTMTTEKEIKPYTTLADANFYTVVTLVMENRHGSQNIHAVPDEARAAQARRLRGSIVLL